MVISITVNNLIIDLLDLHPIMAIKTPVYHGQSDLEPAWECISDLCLSTLLVAALVKFSTRPFILITLSVMLFQWIFDSWFAYHQAVNNRWSSPATIMAVAFTLRWVFFLFILDAIHRCRERICAVSLTGILQSTSFHQSLR